MLDVSIPLVIFVARQNVGQLSENVTKHTEHIIFAISTTHRLHHIDFITTVNFN